MATKPDYSVTETDVGKTISGVCVGADGTPADLSTATLVQFRMGKPRQDPIVLEDAAKDADQITNPGRVAFELTEDAVAIPGDYGAQFVVEWTEAVRLHFPTTPILIRVARQA